MDIQEYSTEQIIETGNQFCLDGTARSAISWGSGHIHDTFLINARNSRDKNRYILQKLNTEVFPKPESVQDNIGRILKFFRKTPLEQKVLQLPELVLARDGNNYIRNEKGDYWRCFEFIEKSDTFQTVDNPEIAFEGGRCFGYFIAALKDYNPRRLHITIPRFMDAEWRQKQLAYAELANPGKRLKEAQSELKLLKSYSEITSDYIKICHALPVRVVHNDTKINNILFDSETGKGKSVIDLDTVMSGTALTDFGDMVRSYSPEGREDEEDPGLSVCREDVFGGLTAGFMEAMGDLLTKMELSMLLLGAKVVVYMQAARFLTDFLNGDVYYKTTFPDQNLKRAKKQLNLLASILEKEEKLRSILYGNF